MAEGASVVRDADDGLVGGLSAVGIGIEEVHVNDLIEGLISSGSFLYFLELSLLQEVRQVRFLSVSDVEIMLNHGVS